ncbi:MAG: sulfatase-like hydrolase/transferase [Vicinamibacterales bacterium]
MPSNEGARATLVALARGAAALIALVLLNQSVTFYNVWPTPRVRWQGHLSVELAVLVAVLAAAAWRHGRPGRRLLRVAAAVWVLLVVGRYLDVMAPALYGRPVNLYWDARHLAAVGAMMTDAVATPVLVGGLAAVAVFVALLYGAGRLAIGAVAGVLARPRGRAALGALAAAALVVAAVGERATAAGLPAFAVPVSTAYYRQARLLATQIALRDAAVETSRQFSDSDLSRVAGADVYLTFVESYGAVTYDRPEVATALAPARDALQADIEASGRQVVSAFVESPTFGGSSWLAHVSLITGVETRDEQTNATVMAQERDTLVTAFARAGYRTVALMPGLRQAWPEGAFYGFDHVYDTAEIAYHGPRFGWWTVPDQFALARLDVLEAGHDASRPRFVFFPTTSTHAPFGPTAPYQPDWDAILSPTPFGEADVKGALARVPDYLNLAPSYVNAVRYAWRTLGGYLRMHADRDLVMIVVGDHQPAAAVAGEGASWDVPVHVITGRGAVLDRLRAVGFAPGLAPPRHAISKLHALLPALLDAFGDPAPARASR